MNKQTPSIGIESRLMKALDGEKYGELVLEDAWYVIEKFGDTTTLIGPIDTEALAILVQQESQTRFYQTVRGALSRIQPNQNNPS
jgi:hypothetical protein